MVMAAVSVVFPWSTCPIVPTFTCGFVRSNFCFAIATDSPLGLRVRRTASGAGGPADHLLRRVHPHAAGAHDRNRTGYLLLTMEMLYRLSYVGAHDRDHPSGLRGSDAERKERWTGRCGRAVAARVCAEKTHHPEADLPLEGRLEVSRESGNLGPGAPAVNAKLGQFL